MASDECVDQENWQISPTIVRPSLTNPFQVIPTESPQTQISYAIDSSDSNKVATGEDRYQQVMTVALEIRSRPQRTPKVNHIARQHAKGRMTVWERIAKLSSQKPTILWQNWGKNLDGDSIVTSIVSINGREVAVYGHDFTLRAGSIDATNGQKLAKLLTLAGERGIPVVGMNDSAGAYVPAGVGGLDGYATAFASLRKISGVVPTIMCMFGFNAGGGSYLPRQGSFVIQPQNTFFGLTGPGVVKSVLGETVTAEDLGGPKVHGHSGVADYIVADENEALVKVKQLLDFIPNNNSCWAPYHATSDPVDRPTEDINRLLKQAINSPTGFNTPIDIGIIIQEICDFGCYMEFQPQRARNTICAFGRIAGHVIGFCANNSAVACGQIDCDAAYKNARFIRFCNLYNIPMIFMEDTTGFLPGREQESRGVVQAGRAMLDAIIDLRTPRFLLIVRNAFGGAYASFNNYNTGADLVLALPTARIAVMGPAGKTFVYKQELKKLQQQREQLLQQQVANTGAGQSERLTADAKTEEWFKQQQQLLDKRYEDEFMNPREALCLGSISQLILPTEVRTVLANQIDFYVKHYTPQPLQAVQREFH